MDTCCLPDIQLATYLFLKFAATVHGMSLYISGSTPSYTISQVTTALSAFS